MQLVRSTTTTYVLIALAAALIALAVRPHSADARSVFAPNVKSKRVKVKGPVHLGPQLATWYGPGFYGNHTGCGSVLKTNTWGIAHRTLPCGKMVWLRYKGREIAVPVIDRGPYGGASLDLTGRTATFLHFQGAGNVKMTVLRRQLPWRSL